MNGNGDAQLSTHEGNALLATAAGQAALALTGECPVRFHWLVHLRRKCRHYVPPTGGRVGSMQCECQGEAPAGWVRTVAQARLDTLLGGT